MSAMRDYLIFSDSSSSDDESSINTDDSNISTSDEEDSIFVGDVNEELIYSGIHPHFEEIACAIRKGDVNALNIALDNFNGNIDQPSIDGETALHYACERYSRPCFKLLLQRGSNIESRNTKGQTPLHMCCVLGLYRNVEILFNYTTNPDSKNRMIYSVNMFGEIALHEAVLGRNVNIIKLLFSVAATNIGGINKMLNTLDIFGETPLHQAATYGNTKVVKLLLEFGASTEIKSYKGKLPWELSKPNLEMRRILQGND